MARPGISVKLSAIHPRVDRYAQRVTTVLQFLPPGGVARSFEFHGDPGIVQTVRGVGYRLRTS